MFTIRNAVLVALLQVGVIMAGVLGAGASRKCWAAFEDPLPVPHSILLMMNYGPVALLIPLVWVPTVLLLRERPGVTETARDWAFFSGIILIILLLLLIGDAILRPWFGVDWHLGAPREQAP
jgi:hypothetical protein